VRARRNNVFKKQTSFSRGERIASSVQKHVAEILRDKYAEDPVLSRVSVVGADASGAPQFIKIFYYVSGTGEFQKRLSFVTPMIRKELAKRIDQKYVPDIRFAYDDTLEKSERIDKLLAAISGEDDG